MLVLPARFAEITLTFAPVFVQHRMWRHAQLLLLVVRSQQKHPCGWVNRPTKTRASGSKPMALSVGFDPLGALLTPGQRTVSSILRIIGLRRERHFVNFHRVPNRAVWSSRQAARLLLALLISTFVSTGPIVLGG